MGSCTVVRRKALWLAVLAGLPLVLGLVAGCGGPTTSTSPDGTAAGNGPQVIMTNRAYEPKEITVKVGDTVTWVNEDAPKHDVVAENGEFKSKLFDKGQSFSFTFTKPGTYPYYCSIHPGMTGTVIVK